MSGRNILIGIVLLTSIIFATIVYSTFSTQLQINGEAIVRSNQDVRITGISITEQTNGAHETYNNKYTKDTTSIFVTLPANSSITYNVEITNKNNVDYSLYNYTKTNNNANVFSSIDIDI